MELKPILYILAGLAWYFLKKGGVATTAAKSKVPKRISPEIKVPELIKRKALMPIVKTTPVVNKELRQGNLAKELAAHRSAFYNKAKSSSERSKTEKGVQKVKNNKSDEIPEFGLTPQYLIIESESQNNFENLILSDGNRIGQKIKSPEYDWKQTVVINELLRPVYF